MMNFTFVMMTILSRTFQFSKSVFFIVMGFLFMVWVGICTFLNGNVFPFISSLTVLPLFPSIHDRVLSFLASWGWSAVIYYCVYVGRFEPVFYGDLSLLTESYTGNKLVVSNHVSTTDGIVLFSVAERMGRLGQLRFFAKKSLLFFPILGAACYFLNFVFLARDWMRDRATILHTFRTMIRRQHFWMVLFPEGTRISAAKLARSRGFASEKQIPPLEHVLFPRVKGLVATLDALRGSVDAIVDITIGYAKWDMDHGYPRPDLGEILLSRGPPRPVQIHVRVIPIASIPSDPDAVAAWALELFREKDRLLADFHSAGGRFPGAPWPRRLRGPGAALAAAAGYTLFAAAVGLAVRHAYTAMPPLKLLLLD